MRCMHQSRVYALLIDTPEADAAPAAAFWSAALGVTARPVPEEPQFTRLHQALPGLVTYVQAVDDAPRFHLDIETDDVEAETARLLALGAVPGIAMAGVPRAPSAGGPPIVRHSGAQ